MDNQQFEKEKEDCKNKSSKSSNTCLCQHPYYKSKNMTVPCNKCNCEIANRSK